jgi:hypothetical protein
VTGFRPVETECRAVPDNELDPSDIEWEQDDCGDLVLIPLDDGSIVIRGKITREELEWLLFQLHG